MIWAAEHVVDELRVILKASVPVEAKSPVQAELLAAMIAMASVHLLMKGADLKNALQALRDPKPCIDSFPRWWEEYIKSFEDHLKIFEVIFDRL